MADGAQQDKDVENGVHIGLLVERIEEGTRDIHHTFGDDPRRRNHARRIPKGTKRHKDRKAHQYITDGLKMTVGITIEETEDAADDGRTPNETEKTDAPNVVLLHDGQQRDGRVAACNMPIDGGMVELPQHLLCLSLGQGVIGRRTNIGRQHAEQIEANGPSRPGISALETGDNEGYAHDDTQQYADGMGGSVGDLFAWRISFWHRMLFFT